MAKTQNSVAAPGSVYLQQLQSLALEIQTAIDAIAANSLPALEASVARQEELCTALGELNDVAAAQPMDAYLREHIRSAADAVSRLNLQYGALLRHSGQSIALLTALCKNGAGEAEAYPVMAPEPSHQHTFSLEI